VIEDLADERPCANPECDNEAVEPEADGDVRYWECLECGYAWGYERLEERTRIEGACSLGISENVRRAASAPAEGYLSKPATVSLGMPTLRKP
jgi:hypothetical protein